MNSASEISKKAVKKLFKNVPTTQDVKDLWNSFAEKYTQFLEKPRLQAALSLQEWLKLILRRISLKLDVPLLQSLPSGTKYTSVDISEEIIKKAKVKKESLKHKFNDIEHDFIEANGEDISFIPDESVDVVISPLCIHLTPDPNKILKEALRVLKKGGRLGVSVLEDPQKCTFFSVFYDPLKEVMGDFGKRSLFYLGSREKLIKLAQENGVKVDFCWTEAIPLAIQQKEKMKEFWMPNPEKPDAQVAQGIGRMGKILTKKSIILFLYKLKTFY